MDVLLLLQKSKRIWWSQRILQQWETSQCKPAHFLKMRESLNLAPLVNAAFGCTSQAQHPCPAHQAPSFYLCIISSSWKASLPFWATFPGSGLSSPGAPSLQGCCTAATPGGMWKARRRVHSRNPHCRGWKNFWRCRWNMRGADGRISAAREIVWSRGSWCKWRFIAGVSYFYSKTPNSLLLAQIAEADPRATPLREQHQPTRF